MFALWNRLRSADLDAWIDKADIAPGSRWTTQIHDAIQNADIVLVFLSQSSVKSLEVNAEIDFALNQRKRIIPVLLEDCVAPHRLRNFQTFDMRYRRYRAVNELIEWVSWFAPEHSDQESRTFDVVDETLLPSKSVRHKINVPQPLVTDLVASNLPSSVRTLWISIVRATVERPLAFIVFGAFALAMWAARGSIPSGPLTLSFLIFSVVTIVLIAFIDSRFQNAKSAKNQQILLAVLKEKYPALFQPNELDIVARPQKGDVQ